MNNGEVIDLVALDLRKAFDIVEHKILLDKLNFHGICEHWFKSYISGRKQFIVLAALFQIPYLSQPAYLRVRFLGPYFSLFISMIYLRL